MTRSVILRADRRGIGPKDLGAPGSFARTGQTGSLRMASKNVAR